MAGRGRARPAHRAGAGQGGGEFYVGEPPHQMYVQYWPAAAGAAARACPLVLIHGGAHTGLIWTSTPDGRAGWAFYFAERGWPAYVVDWPGVGRSGFPPDFLTMGATPIVDAVLALLERIGAAALLGHSIGGAVAFKVADRAPALVRAVVALAPAPPTNAAPGGPMDPLDAPIYPERERDRELFANAERFPHAAFEQYFRSLVPMSPSVRNAAFGQGNAFWIERPDMVRRLPILFVAAEGDHAVPRDLSEPAARFFGVRHTLVGADWGLPGHGHLLMMEEGYLAVAERVAAWLEAGLPAAR